MTAPVSHDRFEIRREIGRGAAACVFEVFDRLNGAVRALKRATASGQIERFEREFRLLTQFRHPGIVRAYDYGDNHGLPELSMELVRGRSLHAYGPQQNFEWLESIALQLLGALQMIHARGWIHGDVSGRNILVAGTPAAPIVRLVDFGAAHEIAQIPLSAGTLPYAAPEVVRKETVDGRADLYALGVVLYEILLPEEVGSSVETVARWHRQRPIPPHEVDPVIPSGLSRFIARLLEPQPEQRFENATQALDTLQSARIGSHRRASARARAERLLRVGAVSHRHEDIAWALTRAEHVIQSRSGWTLWLRGAKGTGKTPFLRELDARLCLQGFRVLRCRVDGQTEEAVAPLVKAVSALAPENGAKLALNEGATARDPTAYAADIARTIVTSLGSQPTALIIDDVHLAEPIARSVLRYLSMEIHAVPMLLICGGETSAEISSSAGEVGELDLSPLNLNQVQELGGQRLIGLDLPVPALERLARDSQGMPSLVERTLARLLATGVIEARGTSFGFCGGGYIAATHDDSERIETLLAQVDPNDEKVIAAAAVLRKNISAESVAAVSGLSPKNAARSLSRLSETHLLMPGSAADTPGFIFATKALRVAVYERMPAVKKQKLHDRAARFFEVSADTDPHILAEHRLRGSDTEVAVTAAINEGDRAVSIFADKRASTFFSRGFSKLKDVRDPRRRILACRLGEVAVRGGRLDVAQEWYETALWCAREVDGERGDPEGKVDALLSLARVALSRADPTRAESLAEEARRTLACVPASPSFLRWLADADRVDASVALANGEPDRAEKLLLAALQIVSGVDGGKAEVDVLISLATLALSRAEPAASVRFARRALQRARAMGELSSVAEAYRVLGKGFLRGLRVGATRRSFARGLEAARTARDRLQEAGLLREVGNLHLRQADFAAALGFYDRSLALVRTSRARADESACLHNIGLVNALLGSYRAALSAFGAAFEVAEEIGDVPGRAATALEIGHAHGSLGNTRRALEMLREAEILATAADEHAVRAEAMAYTAWQLVSIQPDDVGAMLRDLERAAVRLEDVAGRAECFIYGARAYILSGEWSEALRWARTAANEVSQGNLSSMQVEASVVLGAVLSHEGSMDEALHVLDGAARRSVEYGLKPLEIEARLWLSRVLPKSRERDEHLTTAMELTRTIASDLPDELLSKYLTRPDAQRLKESFAAVYERYV